MAPSKDDYDRYTKEELRKGCQGTKFIQSEKNKPDLVKIAKEYDADPVSGWVDTTRPRPAQFFYNITLEIGSTMHKHAMSVGEIGLYRDIRPQANKAKNRKKKEEERKTGEKQNGDNTNRNNEDEKEPDVPMAPEQSNKRTRKEPDTRPSKKRQKAGKTDTDTVTVRDSSALAATPSDALQIEPGLEFAETPPPEEPKPDAADQEEDPPGLMDLDEPAEMNDQAQNLDCLSLNGNPDPSDDEEDYVVYYGLASRTELRSACSGTDITQNGKSKPNLEADAIKYDMDPQAYHKRQGKGLKTTPAIHLLERMVVEEGSPLYKLLEAKNKLNLVARVKSKRERATTVEAKSDMTKGEDSKGKTAKKAGGTSRKAEKTAAKKSIQQPEPEVTDDEVSQGSHKDASDIHPEPEPKIADEEVSQGLHEDDELGNEKELHETEQTHDIGITEENADLPINLPAPQAKTIETIAHETISTVSENGSTSPRAQDISETTNTTTTHAQKVASSATAEAGGLQTNGKLSKNIADVVPTHKSARVLNKLAQNSKQSSHMPPKVNSNGKAAARKDSGTKKPKYVWNGPLPTYSEDSVWPKGVDDFGILGWKWPNGLDSESVRLFLKRQFESNGKDKNGKWKAFRVKYRWKYYDSIYQETQEDRDRVELEFLMYFEQEMRILTPFHERKARDREAAEARGEKYIDPDIAKDKARAEEERKHDMYLRDYP